MKRKNICFVVLFALCLFVFAPISYAGTYRITEQELNQLETSLLQLQKNNESSQKELKELNLELETSKNELVKAKQELTLLQTELRTLKETSLAQESLLKNANQSLEIYAQEERKKMKVIRTQRNVAYGLGAGLLYGLIRK